MKKDAKTIDAAPAQADQYMQTMLAGVTEKLTTELCDALTIVLEQQISEALAQSLIEGEFYRRMSKDMRAGLRKIHKEISSASKSASKVDLGPDAALYTKASPEKAFPCAELSVEDSVRANQLFSEASSQLTEVLEQTENAAITIMEAVERQFANQSIVTELLKRIAGEDNRYSVGELKALQVELDADLNSILMALSFQDLTGQRIKRAVTALQEIESTTVELYLSTGLLIQAHEETPVKDLDILTEQTREVVEAFASKPVVNSELKGPSSSSVDQANIDDLLKQLGMD